MYVIGISCFYHDSAAAIIKNGEIIAACEEERLTRVKHDNSFPANSIKFCLSEAGINLDDVAAIVFYDKPLLKFDRLLETYFAVAPKGLLSFVKAIPTWIKEKIYLKKLIRDALREIGERAPPLYFSEHHLSHASSAFFPSSFNKAAVLCIDGVGEWATTSGWIGEDNSLTPLFEICFPHSLGLFYSAFTGYLGFKVNSGEYKMMGLAPYGAPIYKDLILDKLIFLNTDGSYQLNLKYFDFTSNDRMFTNDFVKLFKNPPRNSEDQITQFHKDLAASIQVVTEMAVIALAKTIKVQSKCDSLVLAGGVALNCVANGKLMKENIFKNIWVQPASGDSGGAIGAALGFYYLHLKAERNIESNSQKGSLLGPKFLPNEVESALKAIGANYQKHESLDELDAEIANELLSGKVVGFFQGRMEFGPRALGSRSILGDPRIRDMQKMMNLKIKKRESFRPFAPAVLKEQVENYFDWSEKTQSPYMLFTTQVKNNAELPSVTHLDGSARIQVVDQEIHPRFYRLLKTFFEISGCPVLINTSFNVRGEPIVCTPKEAINCFMTTDIDVLVLENYMLKKRNNNNLSEIKWTSAYVED